MTREEKNSSQNAYRAQNPDKVKAWQKAAYIKHHKPKTAGQILNEMRAGIRKV